MDSRLGRLILGLSAAGYPLTELTIRRYGRRGAVVTEGVCVGLAIRDTAMVATAVPGRLRRGPAVLLWLELCAAAAAAGLGLRLVLYKQAVGRVSKLPDSLEVARRAAVGTLFGEVCST